MSKLVNIDCEQGLLGALLTDNRQLWNVINIVSTDDFVHQAHSDIYKKMIEMVKSEFAATPITMKNHFEGREDIPKDYLIDLAANILSIANTTDYAKTLAELSKKRKVLQIIEKYRISITEDDREARDISTGIVTEISGALGNGTIGGRLQTQAEIVKLNFKAMIEPRRSHSTGIKCLDATLGGGLYEGFTYGLCGAEKAGKTTLAHSIAYGLTVPHLYVAMEMGALQIEQRNLARDMKINSLNFLDKPQVVISKAEMAQSRQTFYLDAPGATLDEILFSVSQAKMKYGIKGFIVDYWQLVGGQDRKDSEERHLRNVAQGLADYSRRHGLFCVLLAQMNREGQLFGGNGLRKACDMLLMIHECPNTQNGRYLKMDASRYTIKEDLGSETKAGLFINYKVGPYFYDPEDRIA